MAVETILTTTNPEALRNVFIEVFDSTVKQYDAAWDKVFRTISSEHNYEETMKTAGLGNAMPIGESDNFPVSKLEKRWISRFTHVFYANSFEVSYVAQMDFKVPFIREPSQRLTRSFLCSKERHHAAILNNAFDSAYPIGDGKPLCAIDHPLLSSGTASNRLATSTDLSVAGLAEALELLRHPLDDRGEPLKLTARAIVVPPSLEYTARILLGTTQMPFTADNDINVLRQDVTQLIVWDYLGSDVGGSDDQWFVIAAPEQHYLQSFQRMPIRFKMREHDGNWNISFQGAERYIAGASDWLGIVGSAG